VPNWREDKAILTLGFFTVFFACITLGVVWLRPDDGQTYQTFVSLLSGFVGAILLHLNPQKVPPQGSTTTTTTEQTVEIPLAEKKNDNSTTVSK
jgi:hypothetical protein